MTVCPAGAQDFGCGIMFAIDLLTSPIPNCNIFLIAGQVRKFAGCHGARLFREEGLNMSATGVVVFVNRRKLDLDVTQLTGAQLLEKAGFTGNQWDLLLLQGEGDPSGGELILANQMLTLKDGEHFRVIPGNRTFGSGL